MSAVIRPTGRGVTSCNASSARLRILARQGPSAAGHPTLLRHSDDGISSFHLLSPLCGRLEAELRLDAGDERDVVGGFPVVDELVGVITGRVAELVCPIGDGFVDDLGDNVRL